MRILNCYMANDSKGHFVTAKEAAKHNRQDVLCCVSCGCPLTLKRGNDGQPPWFERKRTARTVLTGMCYSVGSVMRQGSSSLTRLTGQSAMTSRTWRR